jgi:hypothetical protein
MLHQHGVQRAARATNRSQARRPRISPSFLANAAAKFGVGASSVSRALASKSG